MSVTIAARITATIRVMFNPIDLAFNQTAVFCHNPGSSTAGRVLLGLPDSRLADSPAKCRGSRIAPLRPHRSMGRLRSQTKTKRPGRRLGGLPTSGRRFRGAKEAVLGAAMSKQRNFNCPLLELPHIDTRCRRDRPRK